MSGYMLADRSSAGIHERLDRRVNAPVVSFLMRSSRADHCSGLSWAMGASNDDHITRSLDPTVQIFPVRAAKRHGTSWDGMTAEVVETTTSGRFEYQSRGEFHLLVVFERAVGRLGAALAPQQPFSDAKNFSGTMCFIPAGREHRQELTLEGQGRMIFICLDPAGLPGHAAPAARLLFEDTVILTLATNLAKIAEASLSNDGSYLRALGLVLAHQLQYLNQRPSESQLAAKAAVRGGLAAWQQRVVAGHIEDHLAEQIPLSALARLVRLSPYHFARAFRQSFGHPPHRYHILRRIERAKTLLADPSLSVTEIGLTLGFNETSAFTSTFRKLTGLTPTAYARSEAAA